MKRYVVYHVATGEILRSGVCADNVFELQAQGEDQAVIEGDGSDATHDVRGGVIVPREAEA